MTKMSKAIKVIKLSSLLERTKGLMFTGEIRSVMLETRFGIHTFFVKHPIDVVVLDEQFIVRKVAKSVKPDCFFFWNPKFNRILECKAGTVEKSKIKVGDKLNLSFV